MDTDTANISVSQPPPSSTPHLHIPNDGGIQLQYITTAGPPDDGQQQQQRVPDNTTALVELAPPSDQHCPNGDTAAITGIHGLGNVAWRTVHHSSPYYDTHVTTATNTVLNMQNGEDDLLGVPTLVYHDGNTYRQDIT